MGATGTRLQAIEIGADLVAGQVQHLAAEPPGHNRARLLDAVDLGDRV